MPTACWNNAYGMSDGEMCGDGYMPMPMFDSDLATGIVCLAKCPNGMLPCGLFCVPIKAPICNPIIAKKSIDSLHIKERKLHKDDKKAIHGDAGILSSLPFTNDEENLASLDIQLAMQAERIASWSDWSYPICDTK